MSGGKLSVVTQFPRRLKAFSSLKSESSVADSPENREDIAVGLVTVPGVDKDYHIKDIPIVSDDHGGREMVCMKSVTPSDNIAPPSYLTSTCSSPETVSSLDTATDPTSCQASNQTRLDHMYMSLAKADSNVVMEENVHLREMLVSQLDLIQQQSETILSKDKQLRQLREDNSLLLSRLSRMERRCRGDQGPGSTSTERKGSAVTQSGTKRSRDSDSAFIPDNMTKKNKVESVASMEPNISVGKEPIESFGPCDDELIDEFMSDVLSVGSRPDTPASLVSVDTLNPDTSQQKPSKKSKKPTVDSKRKSVGATVATVAVNSEVSGDKIKKQKVSTLEHPRQAVPLVPGQETDYLYYVGCKNDLLPNVDDHLEVSCLQRGVEVPCYREDTNHYSLVVPNKLCIKKNKETSWRIKSTNPVYSGEAPCEEDTSDTNFLKRHDKFEKEEKQRKRWDLQRLREEQQLQKLRARQEKQILPGSCAKKDDTTSLLPFIETATYVTVCDKIPVSAFGRPIPTLPHRSFSLPWVKSRHSL